MDKFVIRKNINFSYFRNIQNNQRTKHKYTGGTNNQIFKKNSNTSVCKQIISFMWPQGKYIK